jgi:hypothetical protein
MGGFVRLKTFAKTAGDEEFIQAVRRDLRRRPRRRAICAVLGLVLILVALAWMCVVPLLLFQTLSQRSGHVLQPALMGGIATGAAAAVLVLAGFRFISDWTAGARQDRIARLLIEHHDRLAGAAREAAEPEDGPQA